MINPPALALRRRAAELYKSATREQPHDPDAAALLLFYAAECGLKSIYMIRNNLKNTAEERGMVTPARSFVHDILRLADALRIPRSTYSPRPGFVLQRTGMSIELTDLHQAWRYGEKVVNTHDIFAWLLKLFAWIERNQ